MTGASARAIIANDQIPKVFVVFALLEYVPPPQTVPLVPAGAVLLPSRISISKSYPQKKKGHPAVGASRTNPPVSLQIIWFSVAAIRQVPASRGGGGGSCSLTWLEGESDRHIQEGRCRNEGE